MDHQQVVSESTVHIHTILDSKEVSSFSRADAALYSEMTTFRLKGGYLPVVYDDTSSQPSEVPRQANSEFMLHEHRISGILSRLEGIPPFQSDFVEISRAKSTAWAYDHLQVLEQFKVLSWKLHVAERRREGIVKRVDELAKENMRLNGLLGRMIVYQGFVLGFMGIGVLAVAKYVYGRK